MRPPLRVGTVYDFRNTPESGMDMPSLYAAIMDQVVMLDGLGLDLVWFTEHHFLDDGYLPSWVPMAGAIAARTKRVRLSSDVCLLPFNHPVRLAEDLAVLDNISNGRIEVGVGMGYAQHEFRGFGLPVSRRVSLTDEGIEVLRHCFTGEKFSFHGKRRATCNRAARRCGLLRCRRPAHSARPAMTATSCRRARGQWCSIHGARR
jgi:alkanesulfonate monooxygenase SsuD/methylene tetrahydromethanopterin reductase-like flavin-dependent oxidoreductase (luciferase family)